MISISEIFLFKWEVGTPSLSQPHQNVNNFTATETFFLIFNEQGVTTKLVGNEELNRNAHKVHNVSHRTLISFQMLDLLRTLLSVHTYYMTFYIFIRNFKEAKSNAQFK